MTDYQLLRLWDRLKDLTVSEHPCTGMSRTYKPCADYFDADFIDAAAVAILREEMGKEPERPPLTETLRALYDICPEKFDDPTKSFVLATEG